ncbi:BsuBI/PstI family type II restriction endonuclease [Undibacter mobilis]|uniref:Restriction endonuclease n=1 Tax=Undibacter mobilis TaxID=2292256 RepID=A0A371B3J9_9BRAD|nr:BsuBI/PstI family type II restriction endonuclease [Undibacter mobilis]RDV02094.1 restriction endonuclease [Undibacter mobilis]
MSKLNEALEILTDLDLPRKQRNERSALCLLAILDMRPSRKWSEAAAPLMGITPIMEWARDYYDKHYAPNTRETIRRQTMHQFVEAGIARYNPDEPTRPVNSPKAVYQIEASCLAVLQSYGSGEYPLKLKGYMAARPGLATKYAKEREMVMVPVVIGAGQEISLSPGVHSELIKGIWEQFAPRFVPGGQLIYVGDTGEKWGYFDKGALNKLGVSIDNHGKMPDVVIFYPKENWLILAEAVTSHGPVDSKRHDELQRLFEKSSAGLVFVSAFPDRRTFMRYSEEISWETEVWLADSASHLIHYNGTRFLGPHDK